MAELPKKVRSCLELALVMVLSIYLTHWICDTYDYLHEQTIEQDRRDSFILHAQNEPLPDDVNKKINAIEIAMNEKLTSLIKEKYLASSSQKNKEIYLTQQCINGFAYEAKTNGQLIALIIPVSSDNDKALKPARQVRCKVEFF
ncbi:MULTISPECIES: hypothetical protein [unclassified Pantoea]